MVTPAAGEVVLVPFPFSDLSQSKVRSAAFARVLSVVVAVLQPPASP